MYLTPRVGPSPLEGHSQPVTKGWNGVLFVHQGPYEGGVFKFRIDFPMAGFPLNLPSVRFTTPRQVFSPLVHFESGDFDFVRLFD